MQWCFFSWVVVMHATRVKQTNWEMLGAFSLIFRFLFPCKRKENTTLHHSLQYLLDGSLHCTVHRKLWFHLYAQLLFLFPCSWENNSHCCSYYPVSICLCFRFLGGFSEWLALRGGTWASSVIISLSENSSVVWRVNWQQVQGRSAGIRMLAHHRTPVYGKTSERI